MPDINVNKLSEALNTKADIDLNNTGVFSTSEGGGVNLTSSTPANANGKEVTTADFIKSDIQSNLLNYTTNRILEIPQDIKLELNNGTLTLKAGSKVYVPNGVGKFDKIVISADKTLGAIGSYTGSSLLFVRANGSAIVQSVEHMSGSTAPTTSSGMWYDTTNNKIFSYTNGVVDTVQYSLPVALVIRTKGSWTSIDQIFNGFGYIGSTVFVLPGIRCQIGTGLNNGAYTSVVRNVTKVSIKEYGPGVTQRAYCLSAGGDDVFISLDPTLIYFDSEYGYCRYETAGTSKFIILCSYMLGSKISEFKQSSVDSVANSNASNFSQAGRSYLSGLGMPSGKYIDLTLGASGSTYTAPANGWFVISGKSTANGGYCILDTNKYEPTYMTTNTNGWYDRGFIPVRKGQVITLRYGNYEIEADRFKFIYAEGEQNV